MTTPFQQFGQILGSLSDADTTYTVLKDCYSHYKPNISASSTCLTKIADDNDVSYNTMRGIPILKSALGADFNFNTTNTYGALTSRYFSVSNNPSLSYDDLIKNMTIINNISPSDSSFNTYHSKNITTYKDMKKKRDELDIKMRELYNDETSDNMTMKNSSVYMNATLTVLATSLIYLLFAKLN